MVLKMYQCPEKVLKERNNTVLSSDKIMAILKILFFQGGTILGPQCFFP